MAAINKAGLVKAPYPEQDSLFFKIQGSTEAIKFTQQAIQDAVKAHAGSQFKFAASEEEATDMWQNRKYALMSTLGANPGSHCWTTDVW